MKKGIVTKNRDALMSSEIFEKHRYKLSLNAHKLLIGLIQNNDHMNKIFPEVGYDINGLFKFLGVENRNDRYDVVRLAFEEILNNPLKIRVSEKKWSGIPWLAYEFDGDESNFVKVTFTPKVEPYLLHFQKYIRLKGRYITAFKSDYAITLYPVFRWILEAYHGKHDVLFQRLKEITFTDDPKVHPAYNTAKNANTDFLRRVLGVSMNRKTKKIEILKDSPLLEINEKSDLVVNVVDFVKQGRKYTGVRFHVTSKTKKQQKNGPMHKIPDDPLANFRIPLKNLYENMHDYNKGALAGGEKTLTIQEYTDKMGYYIHNGYAHKKMTEKEREELIRAREKKEKKKRSYETESLADIFDRVRKDQESKK
jgi:hypothetical protein